MMPAVETNRRKIVARLEREGWIVARQDGGHDVFKHPERRGRVILPRHRTITPGTARQIAKEAGWI